MNDPIEQLKEEHQNILRGLKLLLITGKIAQEDEKRDEEINQLIRFFKLYADDGHHAKEEEVLFKMLVKKDESLLSENTPLSVLKEQHVMGRSLVANISKIDEKYPFYVNDYNDLLNRHIEMEDEIFPMFAEDYLEEVDIRNLAYEFSLADNKRDLYNLLKILDKVELSLL